MNLKTQVNNICKSGYYQRRDLSAIRSSLDLASAKMATHAFVTSTLDYSNLLFYGLPHTKLSKLQMVQNVAASALIQVKKSDRRSMTAVRKDLHWLPIKARIQFKMLVVAWKTNNGTGPIYLSDLIHKRQIRHNTRSSNTNLLIITAAKLGTCGDRAFQKAALTLWNDLPAHLRSINSVTSFKAKLKTHVSIHSNGTGII